MVGDEFYDRLQAPATGLYPGQWLGALAEETGAALRTALAQGSDDCQGLWALLCGLALMAPRPPADAVSKAVLGIGEEFPDIKDPYETAQAEAGKAAGLLANRGPEPAADRATDGSQPAGNPLIARDIYGSRLLLAARDGASSNPDSTATPPPGHAKQPAPRHQRSLATRLTSRSPRTTRRPSAARSKPTGSGSTR